MNGKGLYKGNMPFVWWTRENSIRLAAAAEDRSQRRAVEVSAEFDVQTECARMVALFQVGSEDRRRRHAGELAGL